MKKIYTVIYDGDVLTESTSEERAIAYIRTDYEDFLADKEENPDCYNEDEEFRFDLYHIDVTYMLGDAIKNRVL